MNLTHADSVIKQAVSSEGVGGAQGESADLKSKPPKGRGSRKGILQGQRKAWLPAPKGV